MNKMGLIALVSVLLVTMVSAVAGVGFQNGNIVSLNFSTPSACSPALTTLFNGYPEAANASSATNCEVGVGVSTTGATPLYQLTPSFAGLSVYGQVGWNASTQGYPTFMGMNIITQCGATGTPSACATVPNSITAYYNPVIGTWERTLGIYSGKFGFPEGVLPNGAHDLLLPTGVLSGTVYLVRVGVYDPNIFPNATTGRCTAWIASNLTNPTGNCLNSTAALARALVTNSNSVATANKNNLGYSAIGSPKAQAGITVVTVTTNTTTVATNGEARKGVIGQQSQVPGTSTVTTYTLHTVASSNITQSNVNAQRVLLSVNGKSAPPVVTNSITPTQPTTVAPTTPTTPTTPSTPTKSSSSTWWIIGVVVVVVIIAAVYMMMGKKAKA